MSPVTTFLPPRGSCPCYNYPMTPVQITWLDSVGSDGWADKSDITETELSVHVTVGFIVEETETAVKMTMSYDTVNDCYGAWIVIPKVNVVERVMLGV